MSKKSSQYPMPISAFFLCGLLIFLSACSSPFAGVASSPPSNVNRGDGNSVLGQAATGPSPTPTVVPTPIPQTVPMPSTDTSCPASGTARAAVMRPMVLGTDQNIVYSSSGAQGTIFKRYDMRTQITTTIVTLPNSTGSSYTQVSADDQWVLFLGHGSQDISQLELVRMDGQGLQTLYCFPRNQEALSAQWSFDQKLIVLSVQNDSPITTDSISLLNVTSGTLKLLFQGTNSDFYGKVSWLDNTHIYVDREVRETGAQGTLYLMNVMTASANNPGFQTVLTYTANVGLNSFDSSPDNTKLFFSYCKNEATTITVNPAFGGGPQQALFQENACIPVILAQSSNTLFMLAEVGDQVNQVWTMHADGSDQRVLATLSPSLIQGGIDYYLNPNYDPVNRGSQFTWFNFSRDGSSYSLEEVNYGSGDQGGGSSSILIGSLSGGDPTTLITSSSDSFHVVGWTTM